MEENAREQYIKDNKIEPQNHLRGFIVDQKRSDALLQKKAASGKRKTGK